MNNAYTFIAIAVYHVRRKRFTDTYRLMLFSRDYTSFVDAMRAVSKALDREPEQPTLHELAVSLCRSSGCHYFDGFGCTRSDVVTDNEQFPCDIDGANK